MGSLECPCKKKSKNIKEIKEKNKRFKKSKKENQEDKVNVSSDSKTKMVPKRIKDNNNYALHSQRISTKLGLKDISIISDEIKPSNSMKIKNRNNKNTKYNFISMFTKLVLSKKEEDLGRINNNNRYKEDHKIIKFMKAPTTEDLLNEDQLNETRNLTKKYNELKNKIENMKKEKEELQQLNKNLEKEKAKIKEEYSLLQKEYEKVKQNIFILSNENKNFKERELQLKKNNEISQIQNKFSAIL
jgi:hypothetical protein